MRVRTPLLAVTLGLILSSHTLAIGPVLNFSPSLLDRSTLFSWHCCDVSTCRDPWSEAISTDRPDFTEASNTVGKGVAQLELGYTYFEDSQGNAGGRMHTYPETLLRVGMIADWFELRLGWTEIDQKTRPPGGPTQTQVGSSDLYVGVKLGLTEQCGLLPEMALIPQMTVPSGSAPFNAGAALGGLNWIYGWELTDRLSLAGSSQFNHALDGTTNDGYTLFAQSIAVGYALDDRWGTYGEYFVLAPSGAETERPEHYFNGGLTWLFNNNLQFDIRAGVGLNDSAIDYFTGAGAAIRF